MHLLIHVLLGFTLFVSTVRPEKLAILPWDQPPAVPISSVQPEKYPICIVGAGISGLNLGILLKAKGYNVEIFDILAQVGGKAGTALLATNGHLSLLKYIDKFQLTRVPFNFTDQRGYDAESGSIQPIPRPTSPERMAERQEALERYQAYYAGYTNDLKYGYLNASPDLFLPMSTWLAARNLTILTSLFHGPVVLQGYGHLDDIPALYALKLLPPKEALLLLTDSPDALFVIKEGTRVLMNKMAQGLNLNLNYKVKRLERHNLEFQEIHFEDGQPSRRCKKVILALPPLLCRVQEIVLDLSKAEKDVLRQVKNSRYTSAEHHLPPLDHAMYIEGITHRDLRSAPAFLPFPEGKGEPILMLKQSFGDVQNVYTSYSWIRGEFECGATEAELDIVRNKLLKFQGKISPRPELLNMRSPHYFPHVRTVSLQDGFYPKFDKLQGRNGLYYATTLQTMETLNAALEMTESFVSKYF